MFTVYILRSESCQRHYYGHTSDLDARLKRHNRKQVRSTKACAPWDVVYTAKYETKSEAYRREMYFKSIAGYNYLKEQDIIKM